uniref:Cadherin domain-containing protein n=1 Tax=Sinocyclocheilus rhinocerous TaxID=307959 RepID=A0A673G2X8_9TELE
MSEEFQRFCVNAEMIVLLLFVLMAHTAYGDLSYSFPEEMKRSRYLLDEAHDADIGMNSVQSYTLQNNDQFVLNVLTRANGRKYGELLLNKELDREQQKEVTLILTAVDGGTPPRSGTVAIYITVLDANDNAPVFSQDIYKVSLPENSPVDTVLVTVSATDADEGQNGEVTYEFGHLSERLLEIFSLDSLSGQIKLTGPIDYEEESSIELPIQAKDGQGSASHCSVLIDIVDVNDNAPVIVAEEAAAPHEVADEAVAPLVVADEAAAPPEVPDEVAVVLDGGRPFRSGTASIHIHVLDANDNVPVFGQSVYEVRALENSARGTVLVKLNATDLDSGIYGEISYSFSHMPDKTRGVVEVNPVTGEVKVMGALDYEEASSHELDVQAKDGGGQSSHCKLIIDVIDVNDNAPVIAVKSTSATVPEDASPGTMVALLHVYDLDTGTSGWVTCEISDDVPFKLVSEVKNYFMLVIDGVLDREMCPLYNITVTAMDAGSPPLFSSKTVAITVIDINDNPPIFRHSDYSIKFVENQPRGTLVIKVTADDADEGQNARILYSLSEDAASHLSINAETGEIFTLRPFDYETSTHFHVQVMARDEGRPSFTSTCTVQIFIADQNDNAPVVLYPVQFDGYLAHDIVPRAAPAGYLVTKVVAIDADAGHNAWLSYRIVKATQPNLFSIGLHCGEIRTLRSFAEDEEIKQTLIVSVSDNGLESLSATATVNLMIEDGLPIIDELFAHGTDKSHGHSDLTLYLIMALAGMSSLFLVLIIAVVYMRLWAQSEHLSQMGNMNVLHATFNNLPSVPICLTSGAPLAILGPMKAYEVGPPTTPNIHCPKYWDTPF